MNYNCAKCGRGSEIVRPEDCYFCGSMTPSIEPNEKRYCSYCGVLCREQMLGAETNMIFYGDQPTIPLTSAYDKNTGERNYCYKYTCPNWKKKVWGLFYAKHDDYFVDEVIKLTPNPLYQDEVMMNAKGNS